MYLIAKFSIRIAYPILKDRFDGIADEIKLMTIRDQPIINRLYSFVHQIKKQKWKSGNTDRY
ncbi:hypothetical protein FDUTEX481_01506 [Tolypothrix sp. PCC 7601]|nr:hypothetical protein FDUTEX481_01506 [Tolypothrix sp. PCC 7601]